MTAPGPAGGSDTAIVPRTDDEQALGYALAMAAKLLCSGVFVSGRDAATFVRDDLYNHVLPESIGLDQITVDRDRGIVTITGPNGISGTAVYNGDQGCTIAPDGRDSIFFDPEPVPSSLPDPDSQEWPMGDRTSDSVPAEVDADAIKRALDRAFADSTQRTRAMVVVYDGQIVGERYAAGFDRHTPQVSWSMGKSITSALIGILVGDGHFQVEDTAPIPEWRDPDDPRSTITINHLLHMSSGLQFERLEGDTYFAPGNDHNRVYFDAINVFEHAISSPLEFPPDTVWRYRNCDTLTLGKIIRDTVESRGEKYLTYPQRALFDRIGMRNMVLEPDSYGNFIMTGFDYGTARDWARFGLLHLWDGIWQGERVLPAGWVDYVRTPAPAADDQCYGAQFWLNRGGTHPDLPRDAFWAAGARGQRTMIIPSRNTVIVRLGHSVLGGFDEYFDQVVSDILAAIDVR